MYNPSFSVAGMGTSAGTNGTSSHFLRNSTSNNASTLGESLGQSSRTNYQSGYLMSSSNINVSNRSGTAELNINYNTQESQQNKQKPDETPIIPTKAKMNNILLRSESEFGQESMFQNSRQRQNLDDEDAPPMVSVNDIPNESYHEPIRFRPTESVFGASTFASRTRTPSTSPSVVYVTVFGYPPDKYSLTVDYFQSLGDATDAIPSTEIVNCFKIGYRQPGDAMRAVRKNGEILGGSWMIGAKWTDPNYSEMALGHSVRSAPSPVIPMDVDQQHTPPPHFGTPVKLASSASIFRKGGSSGGAYTTTPISNNVSIATPTSSKGVIGQVSDLIFGW